MRKECVGKWERPSGKGVELCTESKPLPGLWWGAVEGGMAGHHCAQQSVLLLRGSGKR